MKNLNKICLIALLTATSLTTTQAANGVNGANYRVELKDDLVKFLSPQSYDNDLISSCKVPTGHAVSNSDAVLIATKENTPVAYLISATAQGYASPIHLYSVVTADGTMLGVSVLTHDEDLQRGNKVTSTNWLDIFKNISLNNLKNQEIAIKKDGGKFDSISRATITSRGVVAELKANIIEISKKIIKDPTIVNGWQGCNFSY